ncbi:MAG TPA: hypothetical protein VFO38_00775 [Candidatus Saccharimonadales bacterium]|nr:hypothetical protein [Candidatus Saccharimonadales bacterium]
MAAFVTFYLVGTAFGRLSKSDKFGRWCGVSFALGLIGAGFAMATSTCLMAGYANFGWLRGQGQFGTILWVILGVWVLAGLIGWLSGRKGQAASDGDVPATDTELMTEKEPTLVNTPAMVK